MITTLFGFPLRELIHYFGATVVLTWIRDPSSVDFDKLAEYEIDKRRHCRIGKVTHKPSLNYQALRSI